MPQPLPSKALSTTLAPLTTAPPAAAGPFGLAHLDVQAFALAQAALSGTEALGQFPRLAAECRPGAAPASAVEIFWQARGEQRSGNDGVPQTWLVLQAQAQVALTCQRCLEPVDTALQVDQAYRFVAGTAEAEAQDDVCEEDVLALATDLDGLALLEDELLMALPLSPRHEACPQQLPHAAAHAGAQLPEKAHPFAALQVLKDRL
ncbi:MAG: YceD family protein [Burkholderiaceae bacterium]